jgi:hypothetical protein
MSTQTSPIALWANIEKELASKGPKEPTGSFGDQYYRRHFEKIREILRKDSPPLKEGTDSPLESLSVFLQELFEERPSGTTTYFIDCCLRNIVVVELKKLIEDNANLEEIKWLEKKTNGFKTASEQFGFEYYPIFIKE